MTGIGLAVTDRQDRVLSSVSNLLARGVSTFGKMAFNSISVLTALSGAGALLLMTSPEDRSLCLNNMATCT